MAKLLLDTSFLMDIFKFGIVEEIEDEKIYIVTGVMKELKELAKKRNTDSRYAKLALKWLEVKDATVLKSSKAKTDDMLVELAAGYTVGTDDRELRKRLKATGAKTIYTRALKHLELN